jgi:tetratricopeptide (TPR) repeat protein
LYAEQEKWSHAVPYYQRAVHLQEQADDPSLMDTLLELSRVYEKMGRADDARVLRERAARLQTAD